ncbi:Transcriptional regulator [Dinochytrium kinnereticum]|nr:Transcriptional regulator [Dinochytrium kinnereticum]
MTPVPIELDCTEIPLVYSEPSTNPPQRRPRLYQQYVAPEPSTEAAVPRQPSEIPSLAHLQQLMAEIESFKTETMARETQLKQNLEIVQQWLRRNEKPMVPATATAISAPASVSPTVVPTPNASMPKTDKKSKHQGKVKVKEENLVKVENEVEVNMLAARTSMSPQLKKKRKREREGEVDVFEPDKGQGSVLFRKTDDGSVKIEVTQNGKLKLKIPATSPPPPPTSVPTAPTILKAPSRASTPKLPKPKAAKGSAEKMKIKQKKRGKMDTTDEAGLGEDRKDDSQAILEGDYSKAKAPPNQIPITQFWSFCDQQFFRPLQDEDFAFLDCRGDEITPFIVPLLGRHYLEQWADEEGAMLPQSDSVAMKPNGFREYEEMEDTIFGGDIYLGSLTERVLSSLQEESLQMHVSEFDNGIESRSKPQFRSVAEMMVLEDRLKNEIRFLGLLGDEEVEQDQPDEDEIANELRRLQQELRSQILENTRRKQRLREIASYYRGWEQYNLVLDAMSKQIEADYLKRFKQNPKNRRKIKASQSVRAIPEATLENIEKRKMLIEKNPENVNFG